MAITDKKSSKKPNKVAFGTSERRFHKFFLHPGLDRQGIFQPKSLGCDPCLYHPQSMSEAYEVNKDRDIKPWAYKQALEEWSKNLGYRNTKILDYKLWQQKVLGPAWHEVTYPGKCNGSIRQNTGFGSGSRKAKCLNKLPGPGMYYNEHPYKAPYGPHTLTPSFEWTPPCRFPDTGLKWAKAPNRYTIIDKESIENKPKKLVSKRGPYDFFTGRRDNSTIKNHFGDSLKCSASTWPLSLKGSFERYKKTRLGVMNKTGRDRRPSGRNVLTDTAMCYKNPMEPGPGAHDVDKPRVFTPYAYPFNSSDMKARGYKKVGVWPAVGRYSWKDTYEIPGHGHKHAFLSTIQRTMGAILPQPMNSF